jgi:hypothetical protein
LDHSATSSTITTTNNKSGRFHDTRRSHVHVDAELDTTHCSANAYFDVIVNFTAGAVSVSLFFVG